MQLTIIDDWTPAQMKTAEEMARALGYGNRTAFTSGSGLPGLQCMNTRPTQRSGTVIYTAELGALFVQTSEEVSDRAWELELEARKG